MEDPTQRPSRESDRAAEPDADSGSVLLLVAALGCIGVLAALAHPLFLGRVYTEGDLGNFHLPMRHFYSESLARGLSFDWFPYQYTGFHLHGEGQQGLYHPLNWLLYRFVPLTQAFTLELVRNYAIMLAGGYAFARRIGLAKHAAALCTFLFTFSSFNLLHFTHTNAIGILAHLPWSLWAIEIALSCRAPRAAASAITAIALITASQLLLGHPQFTWLSLLGAGLYAALRAPSSGSLRRLCWLAIAVGCGIVLGGVQLLPQLAALAHSNRLAPTPGFSDTLALHPVNLVQIVAPYLFERRVIGELTHEFALYAGAAAPALIAWVWIRRAALGRSWPIARTACGLALVGIVLALGDAGGLHRLLTQLSFVDLFRAPTRYSLLFQLGIAIASAIGFADLVRVARSTPPAPPVPLWPLALPVAASLLVAGIALAVSDPSAADTPAGEIASAASVWAGPLLVGATTGLVAAAIRGWSPAPLALLVLILADVAGYGLSHVGRTPPRSIDAFASQWPVQTRGPDYRLNWGPPSLTLRGIRLASGYVAIVPDRVLPVGEYERPAIARETLRAALRVASIDRAYGGAVAAPLPRARLVSNARRSRDPLTDLAEIDVATIALVEEDLGLGGGRAGRAEITRDDPGHIRIVTRSPSRQLLVISESYHEGWRASTDGEPCWVHRVYGDFMGCVVAAGEHEVQLHFDAPSLHRGVLSSALGAVLCGFLYAAVRLAETRRSRA